MSSAVIVIPSSWAMAGMWMKQLFDYLLWRFSARQAWNFSSQAGPIG